MTQEIEVTFVVIAYNAEQYLPAVFSDFLAQDFPRDQMEFLFVDSMSDDKSLERAAKFKAQHKNVNFKILNNPNRILASGWNTALGNARGDIIIRIDAHARTAHDFIRMNVERLKAGEYIAGGPVLTAAPQSTWRHLIFLTEASRFGGGAADFRNLGPPRYIDTLAYAAYNRTVFHRVGGYDERLVRTEDNEIHRRMKLAGYKFFFDPQIKSYRIPRSDLRGFLKQKFGNGYWIGLTMGISPKCFSVRHFIPAIFVLTCLTSLIAIWTVGSMPFYLLLLLYFSLSFAFSFNVIKRKAKAIKPLFLLLPGVFFLIHVVYGFGTLVGIINIPNFLLKHKGYKVPRPI